MGSARQLFSTSGSDWMSAPFSTYGRNASCRYSRVASDGIRVMMVGSALLGRIAKKLYYHTLVDLEFYPAVDSDMCSYSHNHDNSYDDL